MDILINKNLVESENKPFSPSKVKLCHKCLDISAPKPNSFTCCWTKPQPDPGNTPYAFMHTTLYGDYSVIPEIFKKKSKKEEGNAL